MHLHCSLSTANKNVLYVKQYIWFIIYQHDSGSENVSFAVVVVLLLFSFPSLRSRQSDFQGDSPS